MGAMFEPGISTRDLERYGRFLNLTPEQFEAAAALLEGYQSEFDAAARKMREATDAAREEFRDTRDFTVWDDIRPKMEAFQARRKELEAAFLRDIKDIVTEEQAAKWPTLERMRRRDLSLRRGFISGEGMDVIAMTEELKLSAEALEALKPALQQYEIEMDRALIERNELYEQGFAQGMTLFRQGDMAAIGEIFNKAREAAVKVRDINRRFARQVEGLLPESSRGEFAAEFREKSFPSVYRESYAARAMEIAEAFEDATPEQKQGIASLRSAYEREAATLNDRWAKAIEENEMTVTPMQMMGGGGSPAIRDARTARRNLDDRTVEKLKGLLTEGQVSRLPDQRGRDNEDADRPARRRRGGQET